MKKAITILTALLIAVWASAQTAENGHAVIRILTYNIYHGETMKGDYDLDLIAGVIKAADPDLVALQEVDFKTKRAKGYDLATEMGIRTGMVPLFGRAMPYDGGEYGEAVLSKYSIVSSRLVALPFTGKHEPRAALEVTTVLPSGDTVAFVATHLDHLADETDRLSQAAAIDSTFSRCRVPVILAGDLNAVPGSRTIMLLEKSWGRTYDPGNPGNTFPSDSAVRKIDYVMFRPAESWKVTDTRVICHPVASDHCAYLVTLELVR